MNTDSRVSQTKIQEVTAPEHENPSTSNVKTASVASEVLGSGVSSTVVPAHCTTTPPSQFHPLDAEAAISSIKSSSKNDLIINQTELDNLFLDVSGQGSITFTVETDSKNNQKSVYMTKIAATTQGRGFGTKCTRYLMMKSFSEGCQGRLVNEAAWSSHIFHLYMGMIPKEREVDAYPLIIGYIDENRLANYFTSLEQSVKANKPLTPSQQSDLSVLKRILEFLDTGTVNPSGEGYTLDDVLRRKDEIIRGFDERTLSYIKHEFIPRLLRVLRQNLGSGDGEVIKAFNINTSRLGSISMEMSNEGIQRWKEAIQTHTDFAPFKNFEQLHPYMTEAQIQELKTLLSKIATQK